MQRTFAIIKPDAVAAGQTGEILAHIQKAGFKIGIILPSRITNHPMDSVDDCRTVIESSDMEIR